MTTRWAPSNSIATSSGPAALIFPAYTSSADGPVALPDSLVGTDSHTTMINGLGVLGWGVGGIEAEAGMLGQPLYMVTPQVVGFRLPRELTDDETEIIREAIGDLARSLSEPATYERPYEV